ncbi:TIGR04283 family arsenosugar biosynthesis glycosyltransferase [Flavobacteriaceae bacterium F89]|uniref:TIGR04283 family arsenosugar biosynthesis glycosyltransferase n=1 Tax=Cerina litoralis TaxID=2874477 RepID=A0AAE3ERU2_9FLAO|nr:TIGR04283 family arsenosugar biosynthesis glycosyltransferase [Cerina litoralis]MCG2459935.1 TIGR04283 family arsenosugar biosynthesis glycosyltransferase [Cerina litoralis]
MNFLPAKNINTISIVIPVLNEEKCIGTLLNYLLELRTPLVREILVIDGGSRDDTFKVAEMKGVTVISSTKGRAKQMNVGARYASGNILYFLHVDTIPPPHFDLHITNAVNYGNLAGCFRMKFDSDHWFLSRFAYFTRFNYKVCRGGDQSLFVTKELFQKLGGYNEEYIIYEDSEFAGRLYKASEFKVLPQSVVTSARKYRSNGMVNLQYHFGVIHLKNYLGAGPKELYDYYKRKIVD